VGDITNDLERILLSEQDIQDRVRGLAEEINQGYAGVERLFLVGILKGAFMFLGDLARHLTVPHVVDFMALSSYGKTATTTGEVRIIMDLREPIMNQHVLVVEDIVDTGSTLSYLLHMLRSRQPASLRTCVFCQKEYNHVDVPIDYLGFKIPDIWVVGYGLDYADMYRTLPYVAELKEEIYKD